VVVIPWWSAFPLVTALVVAIGLIVALVLVARAGI
jgi:hypothetical protein